MSRWDVKVPSGSPYSSLYDYNRFWYICSDFRIPILVVSAFIVFTVVYAFHRQQAVFCCTKLISLSLVTGLTAQGHRLLSENGHRRWFLPIPTA